MLQMETRSITASNDSEVLWSQKQVSMVIWTSCNHGVCTATATTGYPLIHLSFAAAISMSAEACNRRPFVCF